MSLVYGLLAGLAFGLTTHTGAFIGLPLLVLCAGMQPQAALPVLLLALALCSAVAAGDAVRARQCDARRALHLAAAGVPVTLAVSALVQWLPAAILVTIVATAACASAMALWRLAGTSRGHTPAALWRGETRSFAAAAAEADYPGAALLAAGAVIGAALAAAAAPGAAGVRALQRRFAPADEPVELGSMLLAVALVALVAAGFQFVLAPAAPGYVSGLYVLGAVAGAGFARRVERERWRPWLARAIACGVLVGMLALLGVAVAGWL
ncbi:TSUP family transporter [Salinisphaera orenii]|nr:TSUP family transporter [Salinisphaera orenii]